jgi:hypothetical protein
MDDLVNAVREILARCVSDGMALPFIIVAASANGSVLAVRMTGDGPHETLAAHSQDGGFRVPMTFMVSNGVSMGLSLVKSVSIQPRRVEHGRSALNRSITAQPYSQRRASAARIDISGAARPLPAQASAYGIHHFFAENRRFPLLGHPAPL